MQIMTGIFLRDDADTNATTIRIPVNPQKITIDYPVKTTEYDILGIGPVALPQLSGMIGASWESYFPFSANDPMALTSGGFWEPLRYVEYFEVMRRTRRPHRFVFSRYSVDGRHLFDTNLSVTISSLNITDQGGEPGDIYYSIGLTEHKSILPSIVQLIPPENEPATDNPIVTVETPQREVPVTILGAGDEVVTNGRYYYTSLGGSPYGEASNLRATISRTLQAPTTAPYPIHLRGYGWVAENQLQKVV